MTITFPLDMPTDHIAEIEVIETAAVASGTSPFTFSQEVQVHQGQLMSFMVSLTPMEREDAEEWIAFFRKLNGMEGTFLLPPYHASIPRGVATGAPVVDGADQTGRELVTRGWSNGVSGILKAGDYISLGSGSATRLYSVLNDVDSDGSGDATLDIWPRLRESPADGAAISVTNPKGIFRMTSNTSRHGISNALIYTGMSFTCREAF